MNSGSMQSGDSASSQRLRAKRRTSEVRASSSSEPWSMQKDVDSTDLQIADDIIEPGRKYVARPRTAAGSKVIEYSWLDEAETQKEVRGLNFLSEVKRTEQHYLSSVLIGLEGSSPQCTSAFGHEHSAMAAVSKISACGNHKWKCYRLNNAMQIPASTGGMRMKINRRIFEEFMETCNALDLLDCSSDLTLPTGKGCSRELLNHRFFEKELFKQILGGSAISARRAVECMKEMTRKTYAL